MEFSKTVTLPPPDELPDIAARAVKSGGAMFLAKSVRFGFLLLVNFILINLLLPADFGMVRYVMLVVGVANLLNEMGLTTAIVQKERLAKESLWSLFLISSLWGVLLYSVIFFSAPWLARFFAVPELTPLLRVGALMIPAAGISAVHRAWLRRRMEYGKLALIEMSAAVTSAVISVTLAFAGFGVWALVAGNLVFEGVISVVLLVICRVPVSPLQSFGTLRALLFFGAAIVISRLVDYTLNSAPFYLIGKVIGKEGLGLFSVAFDLAVFPQMAINAVLGNVLISTFSRIRNDDEKTSAGFCRLLLFGSLIAMPLLLVMTMMPHEFLQVVCVLKKNSAWLAAAPLLGWLAAMGIVYVFCIFSSSIWLSQGKITESIGVSVVMCGMVIIAIAAGVHWGLTGICIALFLRAVVSLPLFMYFHYRLTGIKMRTFLAAMVPSLAAGAIMAIVLSALHRIVPGSSLLRHFSTLLCGSLLGLVAYVATLRIFFRSSLQQLGETVRTLLPSNKGQTR
jgi:O-antigen/teichoic acid export membrane protein